MAITPLLSIGLNERDVELLYEFKEQYGGRVSSVDKLGRVQWRLVKREDLRAVIELVKPYLRIKKQPAELILKAMEIMDKTRPPIARPVEDILKIARISDEISGLNFAWRRGRKWNYKKIKKFIESSSWYSKDYRDVRVGVGKRYGFQKGQVPWNRKYSDEVIEKARALKKQGLGPTEIARRLNVKRGTISNWIY